MELTKDKQKEYEKALRIIKAYPEALKIVEDFKRDYFQFDGTHINLCSILSVRACNVVKQYFQEIRVPIKDWNFPVENLSKIDMDKLLMVRNCGRSTYNEILEVIKKYDVISEIKQSETHIILSKVLPIRACNGIRAYFYENFPLDKFDEDNFPIDYLFKIDIKCVIFTNCGRKSIKAIADLIQKYNSK